MGLKKEYDVLYLPIYIVSSIGVLSNLMLLFAFFKDPLKCFRNSGTYLVGNLAFCDMLFSLAVVVGASLKDEKIQFFLQFLAVYSSMFTIVSIALDRFLMINYPFRHRFLMSGKKMAFWIFSVWLLSAIHPVKLIFSQHEGDTPVKSTIGVILIVVTGTLYCKTYFALKKQQKSMAGRKNTFPSRTSGYTSKNGSSVENVSCVSDLECVERERNIYRVPSQNDRAQSQNDRAQSQSNRAQNQSDCAQNQSDRAQSQSNRAQSQSDHAQIQNERAPSLNACTQGQSDRAQIQDSRAQIEDNRARDWNERAPKQNDRVQNRNELADAANFAKEYPQNQNRKAAESESDRTENQDVPAHSLNEHIQSRQECVGNRNDRVGNRNQRAQSAHRCAQSLNDRAQSLDERGQDRNNRVQNENDRVENQNHPVEIQNQHTQGLHKRAPSLRERAQNVDECAENQKNPVKNQDERAESSQKNSRLVDNAKEQKFLNTIIIIALIAVITVLPGQIYVQVWSILDKGQTYSIHFIVVITIFCLNFAVNPLIYCFRLKRYRKTFKIVYGCK